MKIFILLLLFSTQTALAQKGNTNLGKFVNDVMDGMRKHGKVTCDETVHTSSVNDINNEKIEVSSISWEYAEELFNRLANDPKIPFAYPDDGCYARAHYMSKQLEKLGIISDKVFIEGNLRVETENSPNGYVAWGYHVAPVVMVHKDGKDVLMVFDPSIFPRPVPVDEWVKIQTTDEGTRLDRVYNTRRFVYGPEMDGFDTRQNQWSNEDLDSANETMARFLPAAQERIRVREEMRREAASSSGKK